MLFECATRLTAFILEQSDGSRFKRLKIRNGRNKTPTRGHSIAQTTVACCKPEQPAVSFRVFKEQNELGCWTNWSAHSQVHCKQSEDMTSEGTCLIWRRQADYLKEVLLRHWTRSNWEVHYHLEWIGWKRPSNVDDIVLLADLRASHRMNPRDCERFVGRRGYISSKDIDVGWCYRSQAKCVLSMVPQSVR